MSNKKKKQQLRIEHSPKKLREVTSVWFMGYQSRTLAAGHLLLLLHPHVDRFNHYYWKEIISVPLHTDICVSLINRLLTRLGCSSVDRSTVFSLSCLPFYPLYIVYYLNNNDHLSCASTYLLLTECNLFSRLKSHCAAIELSYFFVVLLINESRI